MSKETSLKAPEGLWEQVVELVKSRFSTENDRSKMERYFPLFLSHEFKENTLHIAVAEALQVEWFTSLFTIVSMITVNVFAFSLALLLVRKMHGTTFFRSVFFLPNLIGGIVLGYIWNLLINGVLSYFGVDITFKTQYGFWGLVVLTNWQLIGYMMVIYIAGLQNVPDELLEAAQIDGASPLTVLFKVKLPIVMPSVTICMFLTLANTFKMFDQNLALTAGAPENTTEMLALNIYNTFYGRVGWQGVGQAKAVIFFLIVALIAFLQLKLTSRKEIEQ